MDSSRPWRIAGGVAGLLVIVMAIVMGAVGEAASSPGQPAAPPHAVFGCILSLFVVVATACALVGAQKAGRAWWAWAPLTCLLAGFPAVLLMALGPSAGVAGLVHVFRNCSKRAK